MIQSPNTIILEDERLPGEIMYDAKVMHEPSKPFLYEVKCPNMVCQHCFLLVSLSHGIHCPACGVKDPNHKTYRRLVKP